MYAIISDLHSNIEALGAVHEDMAGFDVEKTYCLGDVIGYGPNPREILDMVKDCEFILMGNHEEGLLFYGEDFNPRARAALNWTRDQLNRTDCDKEQNYALWALIDDLPKVMRTDDAMFVHGSLRDETRDYVLPGDIENRDKMGEIFEKMDRRVCFFGHTHIPGVWTEGGRFMSPDDIGDEYVVGDDKVVINVGSVGQPRDGDKRACYVLVDGDRVIFRRVAYDYEATMRKILEVDMLADALAQRLAVGK